MVGRPAVDRERMESLISLKYPNGRTHDASLTRPTTLAPGDRFELHGREWEVIGSKPTSRYSSAPARMLCVSRDLRNRKGPLAAAADQAQS
jgi:hypothetical protein